MEPVLNVKPRKVRILHGEPAVIEAMVNDLSDEYAPLQWNFAVCDGRLIITVICVAASELRKAQIASANLAAGGRR